MQEEGVRRSTFRRWAIRLIRLALLVFVGTSVVLYLLQDWLIFPGRSTQGRRDTIIRESTDASYELVKLTTTRGDTTVALFGNALDERGRPRADAKSQPTLMFFYGNGMCLADCFGIFRDLRKLGANVMAIEYVGYGMSSGKASETAFYETADAAWDHLQSRGDIDPKKIVPVGWSIGAGVAVDIASRKPVLGLATISAFTSMTHMAHHLVPWLPTSLLLRTRFDNLGKISQIKVPIFLAHGQHDRIIPCDMSKTLADAATASPSVTHIGVDSDHNDIFDMQEAIYGPLGQFIDSLRNKPKD